MSDGFDFTDIVDLVDIITDYQNKQTAINFANEKSVRDNETRLLIDERKNDLIEKNNVTKENLGIQKATYAEQVSTIKALQKQLQDWDLTYQDHIELPEDFKSPDGMSVIDEHTGKFKGDILANVESGYDTLDLINNYESSIDYNKQVIDGLEGLRSKYIRGQEFSSKIGSELLIEGIKDKADLGYKVMEYQNSFKADLDMINLSEDEWTARYKNLAGITSYDPEMTQEKHNSKWNNWKFITGQNVQVDDKGIPFVVSDGPGASNWINSPEWKGLMDQLSAETSGQVTGSGTWDANVSEFLQDKIESNVTRLKNTSTKDTAYKNLNKLITGLDEYTINAVGDYLDNAAAGLDAFVGTDKAKNIDGEIYNSIASASKVVKESIADGEFTYATNDKLLKYLTPIVQEVIKKGIDYDITPDIINDMYEQGDMKSLVTLLLHGALPEQIKNMFGEGGMSTDLPGTFNQYQTTHTSSGREDNILNNAGGLFSARVGGSNMKEYSNQALLTAPDWIKDWHAEQVSKLSEDEETVQLDTDKWFLGFDKVIYNGKEYSAKGTGLGNTLGIGETGIAGNDESRWDILDYETGYGAADESVNLSAVKELFLLYETVQNIQDNRTAANPYIDFSPLLQGKPGIYPDFLAPQAGTFESQILNARNQIGNNYDPSTITDIEDTLRKLEAYEEYYK